MRGDERVDRSSVTERDVDTARELPVAQDRSPLARQAHHVFARELAEAIVAATVVPSRIERGWSNRTRRRDGGGSLRIGLSPDGPRRGGDTSTTATSPVFPSATVRMSLTKTRWLRTISTASAIVLAYWRIARTTSVVGVRGQSLVAALSVTPIFVRSCRSRRRPSRPGDARERIPDVGAHEENDLVCVDASPPSKSKTRHQRVPSRVASPEAAKALREQVVDERLPDVVDRVIVRCDRTSGRALKRIVVARCVPKISRLASSLGTAGGHDTRRHRSRETLRASALGRKCGERGVKRGLVLCMTPAALAALVAISDRECVSLREEDVLAR